MATETMTPELEAINKVQEQVKGFKEQLGNKASKEDIQKLNEATEKVNKDFADLKKNLGNWDGETVESCMKKINKQLEEMSEDIARSKENQGSKLKAFELFDETDLKDQISKMFPAPGKKTKEGLTIKINREMVLRTKAAEIMGYPQFFEGVNGVTTDWTAFTGRVIDPRLYERKRKKNFILDNFAIPSIDAPTLIYLEKQEVSGDDASQEDAGGAEWIASGAQKPMRSFRVTSNKVEAKKIAIFNTTEDKLLRDIPSLRNWIQTDLTQEIREAYNDGLLNNDPEVDDEAPLGLKTNAVQYTDDAGFVIANPNDLDAILAVIAQLAVNHEEPEMVVVSARKYYSLFALKDSQQRYQNANLVYTNSRGQLYVAGVPVVMADEEDVPSTHVLGIGVDGFQIRNYGPLVFEAGLNGEDFRYDRTSFRAYQEVLSYIPSHRYESVVYDTFSNIKTAIGS